MTLELALRMSLGHTAWREDGLLGEPRFASLQWSPAVVTDGKVVTGVCAYIRASTYHGEKVELVEAEYYTDWQPRGETRSVIDVLGSLVDD